MRRGSRAQKAAIGVASAWTFACGHPLDARSVDDTRPRATLPACYPRAPGCFPERLLAPPVVSANGQIRALVAADAERFRVVAIEPTGVRPLAEGACPDQSEVEALPAYPLPRIDEDPWRPKPPFAQVQYEYPGSLRIVHFADDEPAASERSLQR